MTDTILSVPAAAVAAFSPALGPNDHERQTTWIARGAATLLIASAIYGYAVIDPDRCYGASNITKPLSRVPPAIEPVPRSAVPRNIPPTASAPADEIARQSPSE